MKKFLSILLTASFFFSANTTAYVEERDYYAYAKTNPRVDKYVAFISNDITSVEKIMRG